MAHVKTAPIPKNKAFLGRMYKRVGKLFNKVDDAYKEASKWNKKGYLFRVAKFPYLNIDKPTKGFHGKYAVYVRKMSALTLSMRGK